jgi:hypothetical protein
MTMNEQTMPEIKITIKVFYCSRCSHLWERRRKESRGGVDLPITCPECHSPYWNTKPKGMKRSKKLPILKFHGEDVLDSNLDEVL